jgi:S-adenosylmethionine synthetase
MRLFSSEQVSKYHPDKYADQISDEIVQLAINENPEARVAVETLVKGTTVIVAGEIGNVTIPAEEIEAAIKRVAKELRYKVKDIINLIGQQSAEINLAVEETESKSVGAGDQGIMFGYATDETPSFLPIAFHWANEIINIIETDIQMNKHSLYVGDAKTQVTIDLDTGEIETILVSACHKELANIDTLRYYTMGLLIGNGIPTPKEWIINPSGSWTVGGPIADAGVTGRKIVCDQYGGYIPVGGGAFSGKDLSKVDRSASYMARNIAIDMIHRYEEVKWCEIQLAYAIGMSNPMSISVDTNTLGLSEKILEYIKLQYDLTPAGLINAFNGIDYRQLAAGCHYRYGKVK